MFCAISGEAPEVPVASRKSGNIFEKRLIEAYILENGKDPVTNESLTFEDLVELKSPRVVRPRPPTLTSIPSLLSVFQNEWDALALETFTLQQALKQTRQELSTALYQHDAAVRVIARLSKERDEARDALARITVNGNATSNGDTMHVDKEELSGELLATVEATQEKLSKTRRKRALPSDWANSETLQTFKVVAKPGPVWPGARSLSLDANGDLALVGGFSGMAGVFSISEEKMLNELFDVDAVGGVTESLWAGNLAVFATSSGVVKVFEKESEVSSYHKHAGKVTALAIHPSKEILASVGVDKSFVLYDLTTSAPAMQIFTNSSLTTAAFHPDGHLFAAGADDGQIKVYDVKSGAHAADFDEQGPIQALSFSENGIWLAAVWRGSTDISIWDLRKSERIKVLHAGALIESIRWDYTGQFLAIASRSGVAVQQYSKSSKEWSEPLRNATQAVAIEWGAKAQSLVLLGPDGTITILASEQES